MKSSTPAVRSEGARALLRLYRQARKRGGRGLTVAALAELCGISFGVALCWISGRTTPFGTERLILEARLGIPIDAWERR